MKTFQFIKKTILATFTLCMCMPVAIMAQGDGTQSNPFQINSAALLAKIGSGIDGWTLDKHYKQTADINLTAPNWTPVGTEALPFVGTFDGDGKTISNLKINDSGNDHKGLFGYIDGVIKNVRLNSVTITGKNRIGGVVGQIAGGTVQNCYVVNVNITGNDFVGGVAGGNSGNGNIQNCSATSGSINGNSNVGGLVGVNASTVQNCYATVNVSGGDTGGVAGQNNGTMQNCYATGTTEGSWAGGVAGGNNGTMQFCYTTGGVDGTWAGGGVVGRNQGGTVSNCVALNKKVHGNFGGRIVESGRGTLSNNYARENGMMIGVDITPDASGIHGENATATNTHGENSDTWWNVTVGFLDTSWSFQNNSLPHLKSFDDVTQSPEVN